MAEQGLAQSWPVEEIPDGDYLFKRVHRNLIKADGTVMTGAFADFELSVDWSKYSTPEAARNRAQEPSVNAVIQLTAGDARSIPGLSVHHAPEPENRAHSHVIGKKNEEVKVKLRRAATFVFSLSK